ncbi:MAG: class I SAM-dependent methyltransferase [Rhizobiaceae bacterium]|nr:class I SAM-dependent methyltransferase [Rhizobiaceae bacterium]
MRGRFNLWTHLVSRFLNRSIKNGSLTLSFPDGTVRRFGKGNPQIAATITRPSTVRRIAFHPDLAVGEAYMNGSLRIDDGDIYTFLELVLRNLGDAKSSPVRRIWLAIRRNTRPFTLFNPKGRAARNAAHHYDLTDELYTSFLDADRQYSCAYFAAADDTLEQAQLRKKRHIAAKLLLQPGQQVLDIGSGWGGLGLYIARSFAADVLGVTLSTEQHAVSTQRVQAEGLEDRVHFEIRDYRDLNERFDRIVSVGMFEHVGVNHYRTFFEKCATLLKPDGVMVLHSIGRFGVPCATAAFIRKYIFPGGYIPALSEVFPAIEKAGLMTTDVEILRLHYADTLKHWRERFLANWSRAAAIRDERFCRMWEFYLAGSEVAFRHQHLVVLQIQLARRIDTLPLTRAYIAREEARLAGLDRLDGGAHRMAGE